MTKKKTEGGGKIRIGLIWTGSSANTMGQQEEPFSLLCSRTLDQRIKGFPIEKTVCFSTIL